MSLLNIVGFILIFGVLVFIHELGHFLVARRNGIVTEEFGFGFPPRVITLRRGKGRLVIGGRTVVVPGGFDLPAEMVAGSRVSYETAPDKRGRPVLSKIELIDEPGAAPDDPQTVSLVDPGCIYSINAIPVGGFVRMRGEDGPAGPGSFASASAKARAATLLAGPAMNFLLAIFLFALTAMLGQPDAVPGGRIGEIAPGSPAEQAGLQAGDRIFLVDDVVVRSATDIGGYIKTRPGEPVVLTIERDGERFTATVTPRVSPPPGEGAIGFAIQPVTELTRSGPIEALGQGITDTARYVYLTLSVPAMLVRGAIEPADARPVGPVAIFGLTSGAISATATSGYWYPVLQLMGILSAALAITNLLPIPALDGGRLLFIIIEKVRGRRVDPNWEGAIHLAGMVILLGLMAIITYQDIVSPIISPDWLAPLGR
jgi:regulator of sigma E protease